VGQRAGLDALKKRRIETQFLGCPANGPSLYVLGYDRIFNDTCFVRVFTVKVKNKCKRIFSLPQCPHQLHLGS
jgi:hypothetical protein